MSVTQDQVVDYIKNLKLGEVKNLISVLEEELGVEASAPMVMGGMMPAGGAGGEAAAEKTEFDVVLTSYGTAKIKVIKVVRELTGLGLKDAKGLVEGAPAPIKEGVSKDDAEGMKAKLEEVGASVEIK